MPYPMKTESYDFLIKSLKNHGVQIQTRDCTDHKCVTYEIILCKYMIGGENKTVVFTHIGLNISVSPTEARRISDGLGIDVRDLNIGLHLG